jgi:membrane protein
MPLASLHTFGQFTLQVAKRFEQDRCQRVAGALSFTTVLAIVPLTAVMLAVLSLAPGFSAWMNVIQDFIYSNFVPASGEVVQKYLTQFAGKAGRLTAVGLLFLMITAIMLMATIEQAFNDIWRTANTRKLLYRFLVYWALLTLGPILVAGSLTLTSKFFTLPFLGRAEVTFLRDVLDVVLPLAFEFGAVVLLYTVVPNVPVLWRNALAGGLFAAMLLETAKYLFAASMKTFTSYQIIYGAIAALPIFLVWIYISWVIILLGAIVTATLNDWQWTDKAGKEGTTPGPPAIPRSPRTGSARKSRSTPPV